MCRLRALEAAAEAQQHREAVRDLEERLARSQREARAPRPTERCDACDAARAAAA